MKALTTSLFDVQSPKFGLHVTGLVDTCVQLGIDPKVYLDELKSGGQTLTCLLQAVNASHEIYGAPTLDKISFMDRFFPAFADMVNELHRD